MQHPFYHPHSYSFPRYRNPVSTHEAMKPIKNTGHYDYFDLGDPAPNFALEGIVNKEPTKVSLSDYKGKWVVLFFYGSDFTFV